MSRNDPLLPLQAASFAAHGADQLALAALPLAAVALGAGSGLVGVLVALQSASWLVLSLPAGAWADRLPASRLATRALAFAALFLAVGAVLGHLGAPPATLALAGLAAASAAVVVGLAGIASVPRLMPGQHARGNARLELARALATLAAPAAAGVLVALDPGAPLAAAALLALLGVAAARRIRGAVPEAAAPRAVGAIRAGVSAVLGDPRLSAVALCAVFWNLGFFALAASFVPLAIERGLSTSAIGMVLAFYGAGLIVGALVAPRVMDVARPGTVLVFGPASSLVGAALIAAFDTAPAMAVGEFLLGFGPMLWLVARTGLVQAVAPVHAMGSVAAVMQVSVFGVRPLGALGAAAIGAMAGPLVAVMLAVAFFAASAASILVSPLPRLRAMPEGQAG